MKQTTSNTFRFYNCKVIGDGQPLTLVAAGRVSLNGSLCLTTPGLRVAHQLQQNRYEK